MAREANASYEGKGQRKAAISPLSVYPVGSIYLTVNDENPSRYFGGTWELFAPGRALVCVDTGQSEFDAPGKTGGKKTNTFYHYHSTGGHALTAAEMPSHNHGLGSGAMVINNSGPPNQYDDGSNGFNSVTNSGWLASWAKGTIWETAYNGGSAAHYHGNTGNIKLDLPNLQPYMTCYMWKRTA